MDDSWNHSLLPLCEVNSFTDPSFVLSKRHSPSPHALRIPGLVDVVHRVSGRSSIAPRNGLLARCGLNIAIDGGNSADFNGTLYSVYKRT